MFHVKHFALAEKRTRTIRSGDSFRKFVPATRSINSFQQSCAQRSIPSLMPSVYFAPIQSVCFTFVVLRRVVLCFLSFCCVVLFLLSFCFLLFCSFSFHLLNSFRFDSLNSFLFTIMSDIVDIVCPYVIYFLHVDRRKGHGRSLGEYPKPKNSASIEARRQTQDGKGCPWESRRTCA